MVFQILAEFPVFTSTSLALTVLQKLWF